MIDEKGISEIVGEILLIGIIAAAMTMIAVHVSGTAVSPYRSADFAVWVENARPTPTDNIRVIIYHLGGDALGIPSGPESEFYILATFSGRTFWENKAPWNGLIFSDIRGGFEFGENVVATIRHDDARLNIGDKITITVYDYYSKRILYREPKAVENSIYS
ncbi:MAG: type IV pilin N-terminal domain-containing protein [Candidatus Hadarchaeales archaeon]